MEKEKSLPIFEKYLTLWIFLCIGVGIRLGRIAPDVAVRLDSMQFYQVSIPIAICMFFMLFPIMVKIDFAQVVNISKSPKPVIISLVINWMIKPFTKYLLAVLLLGVVFRPLLPGTEVLTTTGQEVELWRSYVSGAILLGVAPCTAMVLMWSYLAKANNELTLVMVAVNSLTMLFLFAPLASLLLGGVGMLIPWQTIVFSVLIYVAFPLVCGYFTRRYILKTKGLEWFNEHFVKWLTPISIAALLATLVLLFSFKGDVIIENPLTILWISIVLIIQIIIIFSFSYLGVSRWFKLPYEDAAPVGLIGTSNHFEVAFATAVMLFGLGSGAALAAVVGILIEVPIMLLLVEICKRTRHMFPEKDQGSQPVSQLSTGS
jgi:ACR3 family arsenite transporter